MHKTYFLILGFILFSCIQIFGQVTKVNQGKDYHGTKGIGLFFDEQFKSIKITPIKKDRFETTADYNRRKQHGESTNYNLLRGKASGLEGNQLIVISDVIVIPYDADKGYWECYTLLYEYDRGWNIEDERFEPDFIIGNRKLETQITSSNVKFTSQITKTRSGDWWHLLGINCKIVAAPSKAREISKRIPEGQAKLWAHYKIIKIQDIVILGISSTPISSSTSKHTLYTKAKPILKIVKIELREHNGTLAYTWNF